MPALIAAVWALLALGSLLTSLIFAVYMAEIAASIATSRNNVANSIAAAVITLSILSVLSKLFAVDVIYAVVASTGVLVRGIIDEKAKAFNFIITAAIAISLIPYMQAMLLSIYMA